MATGDLLRSKLAVVRPPPPGAMSAERAMGIAVGRAARGIPGLVLRMTGFEAGHSDLVGLAPEVDAPGLALLLAPFPANGGGSGPGAPAQARPGVGLATGPEPPMPTSRALSHPGGRAGSPGPQGQAGTSEDRGNAALWGGLVIADASLLAALVEVRTTGLLAKTPPEPRAATRIDALILAGFVDAALAQFDLLASDLSIASAVTGWRSGAIMAGGAAARLTLQDGPFHRYRIGLDLGEGMRSSGLTLAMPVNPPSADADGNPVRPQDGSLAAAVLGSRADLHAVLTRLQLPLSRVAGLRAGEEIPIPRAALARVRLEDIAGTQVSLGRLGQLSGARAVRVGEASLPPDEPQDLALR